MDETAEQAQAGGPARRRARHPMKFWAARPGCGVWSMVSTNIMDSDADLASLRAMHAADLGPIPAILVRWLKRLAGRAAAYIERRGAPCLTAPHRPFRIDARARDQWMICMRRALSWTSIEAGFRVALEGAFARLAGMVRNS